MAKAPALTAEAQRLLQDWEELFHADGTASPFLTTSWVKQWLLTHQQSLRPQLFRFAQNDGEESDAVALLVPGIRKRGPLLFRQFALNTDGEAPADSVVVENNRLLCRPALVAEALASLADYVKSSAMDEFIVSGLDAQQLEALLAAFVGWVPDVDGRESHYVDLDLVRASGGDVLACLSANTRAQVRRALRKYEERGRLSCEVARTSEEAVEWLEELVMLHEARWQAVGIKGAFASAKRRDFHFGFVQNAVPLHEAQIIRVRVGTCTIGVLYCLTAHGFVNFYQSGFHQPQDPHLKPGLVSHCLAVRHFAAAGYREYDFLASAPGESRYKQSLATNQRTLYWVALSRPNLKNVVLRFARKIRRARSATE